MRGWLAPHPLLWYHHITSFVLNCWEVISSSSFFVLSFGSVLGSPSVLTRNLSCTVEPFYIDLSSLSGSRSSLLTVFWPPLVAHVVVNNVLVLFLSYRPHTLLTSAQSSVRSFAFSLSLSLIPMTIHSYRSIDLTNITTLSTPINHCSRFESWANRHSKSRNSCVALWWIFSDATHWLNSRWARPFGLS